MPPTSSIVNQLVESRSYAAAEAALLREIAASDGESAFSIGATLEVLAWVQALAGEADAARETYLQSKGQLEAVQREQAENPFVAIALAYAEAGWATRTRR